MNTMVEKEGAETFQNFVADPGGLSDDGLKVVSYVIANLWVRSDAVIESMRGTLVDLGDRVTEMGERMMDRLEEVIEQGGDITDFPSSPRSIGDEETPSMSHQEVVESTTRMKMEGGHIDVAHMAAEQTQLVASAIQRMQWVVVEAAPDQEFVTCDRPVTLRKMPSELFTGPAWPMPDALGTLPLSTTRYMVMWHRDGPKILTRQLTADDTLQTNRDTLARASHEAYCKRRSELADSWMKSNGPD